MAPIIHIFSLEDLQDIAAREVLRLNGIEQTPVKHIAAFRLDSKVMAVTILGASEPDKPIDLVTK